MMTDPKAGIANIKRKIPIPNYNIFEQKEESPIVFQRNSFTNIKIKVSDYNSKSGKLIL